MQFLGHAHAFLSQALEIDLYARIARDQGEILIVEFFTIV
jgi:hypothetical protein